MTDMHWLFLLSYFVGTALGAYFTYNYALRAGSEATLDYLVNNRFIKTKIENGEVVFISLDDGEE